jgi:hypothetical protein
MDDNSNYNNYERKISNLIKKIIKNTKNKKDEIKFNNFYVGNIDKIVVVNFDKINYIVVGIFSMKTKTVIIKFYLLSFLISIINYFQEKTNLLFNSSNNNISKNNIYIDIYKSFLFLPFQKYFEFLSRKIFKRQKLKIKNIFYKNYYLVDINSEKIIFSLQSLYNTDSSNGEGGSKYQLKIHKKEQIWEEILYHCHILKQNYLKNFSLNFNEDKYQNYYAIVELKSTFPRRSFLIKFLPILSGLALIHEYVQIKLSSINSGEENNIYKECESIYGFNDEIKSQNDKNNNMLIIIKNEPIILKKVNLFFVESFFANIPSSGLFNCQKQNNIYYSKEIMNIINRHIISIKNYNILKNIEKDLYEEYLEKLLYENNENEITSSNKLIVKKNSSNIEICSNDEFNFEDEINNSKNVSLKITKKFILTILFSEVNNISKDYNNIKTTFTKKIYNYKKVSNSKKEINKLSEILKDEISEYTVTLYNYNYNKQKNEDNYNLTDNNNNSFKTNNIFDSNILFNNGDNSIINDGYFNVDISEVRKKEKKQRKNSHSLYNNQNPFDFPKDKMNTQNSFESFNKNKSGKKQESYNTEYSGLDYLGSKEEFFEGEIKNKVK